MPGKRWSKEAASASIHLKRESKGPRKMQLSSSVISYSTVPIIISLFSKVKGQLVHIANCKPALHNFFKGPIIYVNIEKDRTIGLISDTHCPALKRKWGLGRAPLDFWKRN